MLGALAFKSVSWIATSQFPFLGNSVRGAKPTDLLTKNAARIFTQQMRAAVETKILTTILRPEVRLNTPVAEST